MRPFGKAMLVALLCAVGLSACGVTGSGNLVTEVREVGRFDSIDVSEGIDVELVVDGASQPGVSVTYDDDLISDVVTRVRGDTLVVEYADPPRPINRIGGGRVVVVTVDSIEEIELSGGSDIQGSGRDDGYLLTLSGGSDADLRDLEVSRVELEVSGGSDASIYATESVEGDVSGGSSVTIFGEPESVSVDSSGGSDIRIR